MANTPQTFGLKQLRFTFTLNTNARFADGSNTLQLFGLRATADLAYPGPPSWPYLQARIYGMTLSDMQALTGLTQNVLSFNNNSVVVEANAGNGQGWNTVFAGQLITVVPDFNSMPDVALSIYAQTLGFELLDPATPTSFATAAAFADVLTTIAAKMGRTVVNQGVTGQFPGPSYFAGTPPQQLQAAADKAGVAVYLNSAGIAGGTITIAPLGAALQATTVELSPTTGLIGYPTLESVNLIKARAFFNPGLQYGGTINISDTDQLAARGKWVIYDCTHRLSSLMPNGPWFTELSAQPTFGAVQTP